MADLKISQLPVFTSAVPATDAFAVVSGGTTKQITTNQILLSGGTATLASATITGDLTVDTSTLKVDSTNDRVGIGTASPAAAAKLSVLGTTVVSASDFVSASTWSARFQAAANSQPSGILLSALASNGSAVPASLHVEPVTTSSRGALVATYVADSSLGYFAINRFSPSAGTTSQHYKIDDTGVATWSNVGGVAGTAMTLNSTGLGIGASPASKLYVYGANVSGIGQFRIDCPAAGTAQQTFAINGVGQGQLFTDGTQFVIGSVTSTPLVFRTGSTVQATINASGTLLVGLTTNTGTYSTPFVLSSNTGTVGWSVGPTSASPSNFYVAGTGGAGVYLNGTAATSWTSASDERLKDIIEPIINAVAKVGSLRAVIGKFKSDENNTRKPFLIAQDIQAVLPEAVDASNPDQLGVSYTDVIPLLVAAIKELTARVQTLEAR